MQNKQLLIIFLIGMVLTIAGAVVKVMNYFDASLLLILGMTFEAVAGIALIMKLLKKDKKPGGFLDN